MLIVNKLIDRVSLAAQVLLILVPVIGFKEVAINFQIDMKSGVPMRRVMSPAMVPSSLRSD